MEDRPRSDLKADPKKVVHIQKKRGGISTPSAIPRLKRITLPFSLLWPMRH